MRSKSDIHTNRNIDIFIQTATLSDWLSYKMQRPELFGNFGIIK